MRWGGNFKMYTGGIARRHLLGACTQLGPLPATVTLAREEPRQCLEMSRYQSHGYKDSLLADPRVFTGRSNIAQVWRRVRVSAEYNSSLRLFSSRGRDIHGKAQPAIVPCDCGSAGRGT